MGWLTHAAGIVVIDRHGSVHESGAGARDVRRFPIGSVSFGLVLYDMATGTPAFRRDTPAQTLEAIINEEATPLPDVNRHVPLVLWWIVERCLAKSLGACAGASG